MAHAEENVVPVTEENVVVEDLGWGMCSYGNEPHAAEKFMSGTPICWAHWNWVKLDEPAARHWAKAVPEFMSKVDMHDLMTYFPACGVTDEERKVWFDCLRKIQAHSDKVKDGI